MDESTLTLSGLFLSALLSSTLLPGGSEGVLIWLDQQQLYPPVTLLLVATAGNTLGGISTWAIGWFSIKHPTIQKQAEKIPPKSAEWIQRHGAFALLFSWLPVVGDGLCLAAGWFRIALLPALFMITLGKATRYGLLIWAI